MFYSAKGQLYSIVFIGEKSPVKGVWTFTACEAPWKYRYKRGDRYVLVLLHQLTTVYLRSFIIENKIGDDSQLKRFFCLENLNHNKLCHINVVKAVDVFVTPSG